MRCAGFLLARGKAGRDTRARNWCPRSQRQPCKGHPRRKGCVPFGLHGWASPWGWGPQLRACLCRPWRARRSGAS